MEKLYLQRFASGGDDPTPIYDTAANAKMIINEDLRIGKTDGKSLKDIDNDLANVITLDATRVTIPVKIWTNSSPNSSFTAKTVNIPNLNQYDYIEIFFKNWIGGHYGYVSTKCPVANGNVFALCYTICLYSGTSASTPHCGERLGTINTSNNTIAFGNNFGVVIGTNPSPIADNSWGVPQFILGYKFSSGGNS